MVAGPVGVRELLRGPPTPALDFFAVAHALGGVVALRVLGLVVMAGAVVLAARLAALGGGSPRLGAAIAAVFLVHPLFGALEVDGELVSVPVVLAGMVSALEGGPLHRRQEPGRVGVTVFPVPG